MADISNITLPDGSSYNFKDSTARSSLNSKANSRTSISLVPYGTSIPANADLNTVEYLKVGNYYCSLNSTVATLSNCPTYEAFMMTVYSPLSTKYDNESSEQWVYRFREINTLSGRCYRQSAASGLTVGKFSYGTWFEIANTNTATPSTNGLMTAADKKKLDGIASGAQVNTVTSVAGKTGAVTISKNDVGLGNVENKSSATIRGELTKNNVTSALGYTPPTTNTTYSDFIGATSSSAGSHGLVPAPAKGDQSKFLRGDKTWQSISIPSSLPANGGTASNVSGVVAVAHGGTGATTSSGARKNLSIAPIYNDAEPTSDIYNGMIWVGGGLDDNNPPYETGKVDTALSTSSTNPVQNKVITAKINSMDSTIGSLNSSINTLNSDLAKNSFQQKYSSYVSKISGMHNGNKTYSTANIIGRSDDGKYIAHIRVIGYQDSQGTEQKFDWLGTNNVISGLYSSFGFSNYDIKDTIVPIANSGIIPESLVLNGVACIVKHDTIEIGRFYNSEMNFGSYPVANTAAGRYSFEFYASFY
ncbi:pyocin knob domain-containing protein [Bacillota bacterium HCP28S3_F12]